MSGACAIQCFGFDAKSSAKRGSSGAPNQVQDSVGQSCVNSMWLQNARWVLGAKTHIQMEERAFHVSFLPATNVAFIPVLKPPQFARAQTAATSSSTSWRQQLHTNRARDSLVVPQHSSKDHERASISWCFTRFLGRNRDCLEADEIWPHRTCNERT